MDDVALLRSCFDERSMTCSRLRGVRASHTLARAVAELVDDAFVCVPGRPAFVAVWTAALGQLLRIPDNRGPVFGALRVACDRVRQLCPADAAAARTADLLLLFVSLAIKHRATEDDLAFFLQALHDVALRTSCMDVYKTCTLMTSHITS
jgi:hypothetical protein